MQSMWDLRYAKFNAFNAKFCLKNAVIFSTSQRLLPLILHSFGQNSSARVELNLKYYFIQLHLD